MTCPLCGGASATAFITTDRNRGLSDERFEYGRCSRCATLFLVNVPDDLDRFYPPEYYSQPQIEKAAGVEQAKLDLLGVEPGGRLVEIGPGAGAFAFAARRAGFEVTGVEMDPAAVEQLRSLAGVEAVRSHTPHAALDALPPSRVIVMWHVLEHLPDPWRTVESAARNLEPGGTLAIAVPNPESLQLRVLGERWAHIDAPRHLFLIPASELISRARGFGLAPVRLTTRDRRGVHWNAFGWQRLLMRPGAPRAQTAAALAVGTLATAVASPLELRGLNGATYTAIFRKP